MFVSQNLVDRAFIPRPPQEVLVSGFNKEITRKDISTLVGLNWLNDEVSFLLNVPQIIQPGG